MTTDPPHEPRILEMRLEKYAEIAIAGGLWLVGELLTLSHPPKHGFVPDPRHAYKPRYLGTAITELCQINEELRHQIFIAGFLKLPHNGAQATFRRLLVTHTAMLHEALRLDWTRRCKKIIDIGTPPGLTTIGLLHKLAPRD